jgi:peroxiredoxin
MANDSVYQLPADLPIPSDDGAASHLVGLPIPSIPLPSTAGGFVQLNSTGLPLAVVYCYPRTGRPESIALGNIEEWNAIPGARGCTPQSCGYRDHSRDLMELGAAIFGLSTQTTDYQSEVATRLHLPFPLLSDASGAFREALTLPTFTFAGEQLLKRLTLIIAAGRIVHCLYPVFPPDQDAAKATAWIRAWKSSLDKTQGPPAPRRP